MLLVTGAVRSFAAEDPEITMEDIFREIHSEGQQTDTTPPAVVGEGTHLEAAMAEEVTSDQDQEEVYPWSILVLRWPRGLCLFLTYLLP